MSRVRVAEPWLLLIYAYLGCLHYLVSVLVLKSLDENLLSEICSWCPGVISKGIFGASVNTGPDPCLHYTGINPGLSHGFQISYCRLYTPVCIAQNVRALLG